ncbi:hypothetical protein L5B97_00345 [Avibacterium sp. 20-15]|uniref:hypothetical protein n=1 Tax=Avibacterium TaxID=292486 RepID=UPI002026CBCB|nr:MULTISPECIES: hypothetical protein [unclassified Avibacterium]MCW9731951.1 hypothetical protein [Avibacterium sp. 20-15]URL04140.1 hypothetical protein L4F93_11425 [Avibacterium sp. 20-132]
MMEISNNLGTPVPDASLERGIDLDYNEDYRKAKIKELEVKNLQLEESYRKSQDNREMRKEYANKAYKFAKKTLCGWALLVFLYVIVPEKDKIMDIKMFGIITTACTVNILVAFHAVIKGLFLHKS